MSRCDPISRRLLLGRFGSGIGVIGTFLMPGGMRGALAFGNGHTKKKRG